jgi:predicted RNA-binding protein YlxR (DUF448 family)
LCPDPACFDVAVKRRAFGRALRSEVDAEALDRLRADYFQGTRFRGPSES